MVRGGKRLKISQLCNYPPAKQPGDSCIIDYQSTNCAHTTKASGTSNSSGELTFLPMPFDYLSRCYLSLHRGGGFHTEHPGRVIYLRQGSGVFHGIFPEIHAVFAE